MNRRMLAAAMAVCVSLIAVEPVMALPVSANDIPTHPDLGRAKKIGFRIRNDSGASITLRAGEQVVTLAPKGAIDVKMREGEQIVAVSDAGTAPAGTTLSVVNRGMSGNTLCIR